ncbi:hypothetical protein PR048_006953 [Dryococelus australis]|uniref:RNA-directed DNA polymerase n=1 Tax=Dryococelus australis TaxID=614101 RepID=A0ABQ9ICG2_9NEOP|nr:hypothetical protein PR048_006953 [Dryococelus australis]
MHQPEISFRSYTHNVFVPDGKINIKAEFNGTVIDDQLYIVPEPYDAIAGHVWIRKFGLDLCNLDTHATDVSTVKLIDTIENMYQVAQMYPVLCIGKVGKLPDFVVSLKLRKGAQPAFHQEHDVPYELMKKVDTELDTLEAEGVLTKAETSDLGSPLVLIPKADGGVRLCIDYKVGVNEQLQDAHYPIRKIDDILNKKIEYLSHIIEFNQISKSLGKLAATVDMPRPKSTDDARKFLGMVTYYSRSIHGASTITTPFRHLLCKNTIFRWTSACETAFLKLKQAIASDQVLVPYDPDLPIQLSCDASPTGITGVLSHTVDGHEHPIAFTSRSNVDYLSRAPINIKCYTASAINNEVKQLCDATIEQISIPTVTYQLLKEETKKDATLSTVMKSLQEANTSEPDYIIKSGVLFCGQRVVVPASLQSAVLNELHRTPVGFTKMKQLARRYIYWKKIDSGIEHLARSCSECVAIKNSPSKAPSHPWEEPEHNLQQIHIDYAGPYQDHHFLVVVDAKLKWAEIVPCS